MSFEDGADLSWDADEDMQFSVTVSVTNTGDVAGKDVVQVYMTAPYTAGGIEKAHVALVGFAKTELIEPGDTKEVTVTFNGYDFASYDYSDANGNDFRGYELDAGEYEVKVMRNAHEMEDSRTFELSEGVQYAKDPVTDYEVVNRYDDVSESEYGMESVLSRSDWEGTWPKNEVLAGSDTERTITSDVMNNVIKSTATNNPIVNDPTVQMPTQRSTVDL